MTRLTITSKGRVTLKRELLKHLRVSPGDKIEADTLQMAGFLCARLRRTTRLVISLAACHGEMGQS
ncbi:MAG TPA: AbrB/MazE/SpoVT family DNA-binding domain-containing protein [Candidatus Angelobacter sp.]